MQCIVPVTNLIDLAQPGRDRSVKFTSPGVEENKMNSILRMQLAGAIVAVVLGSNVLAQSTAVTGTFDANRISYVAQSRSPFVLHLYDNFNQAFLDPSKWIGTWQCGSPAMESVREIENGQLRLRVRTVEN